MRRDDETKDGQEVESISCHARKCDQESKIAEDAVASW